MNLRYITCSDPRENIKPTDLIGLLKIAPSVEIGIQAQSSNMKKGDSRNVWFNNLMNFITNIDMPLNVALHVNYQWCNILCSKQNKNLPIEIAGWLDMRNYKNTGPAIRRWQLNIGNSTTDFDADSVARLISQYPEHEFILPYNARVCERVSSVHETGVPFSLLYDASGGYGVHPERWQLPVYDTHPMGYAGGISPRYVWFDLNEISQLLPHDYSTWIDAEYNLMYPKTRIFDISRARQYIQNALDWERHQNMR